MNKLGLLFAIVTYLLPRNQLLALDFPKASWFEVCLNETNSCTVGRIDKPNGQFIVYSRTLPTFDIGVKVELLTDAQYNALKEAGLEKTYYSVEEVKEVKDINDDVQKNFLKCLVTGSICLVSTAEALLSGGFAVPLAYFTCYQAGLECNDMYKANQILAARREAILKKVKEEADASAPPPKPTHTSTGGGGSAPSNSGIGSYLPGGGNLGGFGNNGGGFGTPGVTINDCPHCGGGGGSSSSAHK